MGTTGAGGTAEAETQAGTAGRADDGWTLALALADLWVGEMIALRLGRAEVLLVNLGGGELRAYEDRCPHAGSRLHEGRLRGAALQCAAHLWEFDLRSGEGINPRSCRLRRYPVKVEDGAVLIRLGE
jgi:toluene monooxygenase system ferredoxin subunit